MSTYVSMISGSISGFLTSACWGSSVCVPALPWFGFVGGSRGRVDRLGAARGDGRGDGCGEDCGEGRGEGRGDGRGDGFGEGLSHHGSFLSFLVNGMVLLPDRSSSVVGCVVWFLSTLLLRSPLPSVFVLLDFFYRVAQFLLQIA